MPPHSIYGYFLLNSITATAINSTIKIIEKNPKLKTILYSYLTIFRIKTGCEPVLS